MSDVEAVTDIQNAIDYLSQIVKEHNIQVNIHLNPTYAATGTALESAFRDGRYTPPLLEDVAEAARYAKGKSISIFIGLSDEGLAVKGGSFLRPDNQPLVEKLERFNCSHDFNILDEICINRKVALK